MSKEIKDYLHLYLGCEAMYGDRKIVICGLNINSQHIQNIVGQETFLIKEIKPLLRPLNDMTEEEFNEFKKHSDSDFSKMCMIDSMMKDGSYTRLCHSAFAQQYLLSKGFDLFGLIESELAIDSTKLKEKV
jgi:hypothetical protein